MNRLTSMILGVICSLLLSVNAAASVPDIDDPAVVEAFVDGVVKTLMS